MNTATAQPTAAQLAAYLGQWMAVDEQVAAPLLRHLRPCRYERGEHFFQIGDTVDELVLLRDGLVRSYYLHDDREVNLRLLSAPAAAMPYNSYLTQTPADESLQAMTAVEGYRVRFRAFCREQPGLLAETMQRKLAERHFLALQRRLRMLQSRSAAQRYAFFLAHMEPEIIAGTPAYQVASYLGITPESLSRVKADLEKYQGGPAPPEAG
jgi:CRP-like cAMP-binding protein